MEIELLSAAEEVPAPVSPPVAEVSPETAVEAAPLAEALPELVTLVEIPAPERPILTTPLAEYTVTEGLLLLVFVLLLTRFVLGLLREVFA